MLEVLNYFFLGNFIPHGHCYLWKTQLVGLHVLSDTAIVLAYFSIPLALVYFVHKRRDVPFMGIFLLFGAFIVACGTTHIMEIWTLWHPDYWLSGFLKAVTALISCCTALILIPLIPRALALPSPAVLEAANIALKQEIDERICIEKALRESETQLRERGEQLEQTLANLKKTQAHLVQSEKMSSLGHLVAGVAHEINNPVNFITGNLNYATNYLTDLLELLRLYQTYYPYPAPEITSKAEEMEVDFILDDLPKLLGSMKIGADRIRDIVLSLRNFSRLDESQMKAVDIHEGIENTLLILQHRLKEKPGHPKIKIVKEYGNLPLVECYAGQMNQVFMNIISNAIDALEAIGAIDPGDDNATRCPMPNAPCPTICIRTEAINSEQVAIEITDNGLGMSDRVRQHLFDAFFTTKPPGKGTGLGLSISYQVVVEKHGGQIECISAWGQGTSFTIALPIRFKSGTLASAAVA